MRNQCPVSDSLLFVRRPHKQMPSPNSRESDALPSTTAASPTTLGPSDSSSDSESTATAAAPNYPSDASMGMGRSTQASRGSDPPPPPPSAPKGAHAEYQKLLQQRHRERLSLHKNQVSVILLHTSVECHLPISQLTPDLLLQACCS